MKLAQRLAVVSGASSGIGAASARALAARGVRVALLSRSHDQLHVIAAQIMLDGGDARVYAVDLSDGTAARETAARIISDLGVPDILLNAAGAGRWLHAEETEPAEAVAMMAVPYFAAFYLTSAFLPGMLARRSGRIVNVGSPAAFAPWPGATGYAAARWALRGFTHALRNDLHGTGVGVTQVIAGEVTSSYWANNPGAAARMPRIANIFPKLTPEQVANAIVHGLERDSANVVVPFALRVALVCHKIWPWPMERLLISTGHRRPATAPADQRTQPPPGGPPLQM